MGTAETNGRRAPRRLTPAEIARAVEVEPLVGVTAGAKILGIAPPNFRRDAAPKLIEVKIDGSASAYFRSQVEALANEREALANERALRAQQIESAA